jgi:hypothetical protein
MPFLCPLFRHGTQLQFLALLPFLSFAIPLIINELVGKDTATVWLQQTTAVGFPIKKTFKYLPMN